jgi:hypothetical protein
MGTLLMKGQQEQQQQQQQQVVVAVVGLRVGLALGMVVLVTVFLEGRGWAS